jgi:hypothetical protein
MADGAEVDFLGYSAITPVALNGLSNPTPFFGGLPKCFQILLAII